MVLLPNLNGKLRIIYFVAGIALAAYGLYGPDTNWVRITWMAVGGALVVFGLIGFCPILWLFGVRGSSE